jgi:hypothetical protein
MAKSIVTYCDVCLNEDDTYSEGRTIDDIGIGRAKPKTIDLCERHEKELVTPFVELVQRFGVSMDKGRPPVAAPSSVVAPAAATQKSTRTKKTTAVVRTDGREACPLCGETFVKYGGESHFATRHPDQSRARVMLAQGLIDTIFECDQKDCGKAFTKMQGLQMHKSREHGIAFADSKTA